MPDVTVSGRAVMSIAAPVACAAGLFCTFAPAPHLAVASGALIVVGLVGLVMMAAVAVVLMARFRRSGFGPDDSGPGRGDLVPSLDDGPATDGDGAFDAELRELLARERSRRAVAAFQTPHLN